MNQDDHFLSRWSKRKHQANRAEKPAESESAVAPVIPASTSTGASAPAASERPPLPDVASLTPDSDFSPFMQKDVPESLKRQALQTLFQDPRFNVMDGLDVYIDDFSKPDPLPEGWLEKMNQVARLGEYREPEPEPETPEKAEESDVSAAPTEADPTPHQPAQPDTPEPPSHPPEVTES